MATTYYEDGGTHNVNAASGPVYVSNGTTVSFNGTFAVTGDDADFAAGAQAVAGIVSSGSTLNFDTISVYGGNDSDPLGQFDIPIPGLWSVGDTDLVTNDLTCTGGDGSWEGGPGAYVKDPLSFAGDLFQAYGGDGSTGFGGAGLWIRLSGTSTVALGGSVTLQGGTGPLGDGPSLLFEGTESARVDLGLQPITLVGDIVFALYDSASVVVHGSGLSWTGGNLTAFGQTGSFTGHIGTGPLVTVTVRCGGDSLTVTGSGSSLTFTA